MFFHVIKGSQSGAMIELDDSRDYLVAPDLDADIYLKQDSEPKVSFSFSIEDGAVLFSKINGTIINNDDKNPVEIDKSYAAPLFLLISDLVVAISPNQVEYLREDDNINEINHENAELNELNQELSDDFLDQVSASANIDTPPTKYQQIKDRIFEMISDFKDLLINWWEFVYGKLGKWLYALIGLIFLFIFILVFVFYQLKEQQSLEYQATKAFQTKAKLAKVMLELPAQYSGLRLNNQGSNFVITGVLQNQASLDELKIHLKKSKVKIDYKIMFFDQIKPKVIDILTQDKVLNPKITFEPGNGMVIRGITASFDNVNNSEIDISNQVGDIGQLETSGIYMIGDIDNAVSKMTQGFADQLTIDKNYESGVVNISGYLSRNDLNNLENQVYSFNQKHRGVIKIKLDIQDVFKALPFYIKEVYTGNPGWVVTNDGTRLYEGGTYESITLVLIEPNKVTFKSDFVFSLSMDELMDLGSSNPSGGNVTIYQTPGATP